MRMLAAMNIPANDAILLNRLRSGDEQALDELFVAWHGYLYKIAYAILHDTDAAKDAVQDVFIRIWQKRAEIDITSTLKGYLQRAAVNQCLMVLRRRKPASDPDIILVGMQDPAPSASDRLQAESLETLVQAAVEQLPEQCRLIFRLSRFEELSYNEIADLLDLSPKTVENQIGKALKSLRRTLAPWLAILLPVLPTTI
ncbi:MAG: RNA polymerase sigma-70 factor [Saprospiraceae bacterium]|nr:RNA polymerase sigma-70 factor [Saprospiraceae bacterium]